MAIQFMRGTSTQRKAATDVVPAAGQPFFETNTKKLYIGDGTTKLSSLYDICYDLNPYSLSVDGGAVISSDIWCYGNLNIDGSSSLGSTTMSSAYLPKVSFQRDNATVVNLLSPTSGGSTTTNIYLPAKAGTMALTSDIPTGALASKSSASGSISVLQAGITVTQLGYSTSFKAGATISLGNISSYDYLYFEGYDSQSSASNADTACLLIPRIKAVSHSSTSNSISVTRDGARARVYITGGASSNATLTAHATSYINYLYVWGIKRTTQNISVSVS